MYVDGHLDGPYKEKIKVSGLETMQFSATGIVEDIHRCVTMDAKMPDDLIYIIGTTRNELGASEYYEHFGFVGLRVPEVFPDQFKPLYKALHRSITEGYVASAHGIYRGGLAVHLAMVAMGGNLGLEVDLGNVIHEDVKRSDHILFSESAGRFIVTVSPDNKGNFESVFKDLPCACIGNVTRDGHLTIKGINTATIVSLPVSDMKSSWKKPFGDLI
jgi:phosphoribosylformylglycinamidine synthase